ncbi:ATP:cob(I)alamin adenosyltransferase [candidate division WWE3 bacterium RIFCSPHIGHO2_12_FULL_38_15]|uniref:Corrinoid adenosyltransferase n=1 Tax=candidate division WWE3 bacterium RIFCSPHIGHO2_02_FULL_38_14 TaxID=1802620 RepID=A0A1F4VBF6_UNCKA|nr:MAG: ATP:cob(I)alamin adenosyltransferase [candidate division WWE3 bacterium RIFCSPHIGHO2_01_FULL_38_45]OGC49354.1 MAG: ATP:cob(I)alamin adenosyltransferase [candidate division WWE3 bacterium RIFCSPHIGHO2_12_FULL_38_15]OGC53957.1 MAG: ATP:cob(I)alamin adenosyltransferase [candidate division WWE3 bacterium RIFCSPLOWO2_01_FULL_37_24]OGC54033.1 MAG: ATP:cob(I)alamin adenosyltransferase [candidate division WWE3 bacterium RIFCSPHIGHO2_02_FULL_38_14]HLB51453.1 cob(I)yrinic acid a,c-diamide adenosy
MGAKIYTKTGDNGETSLLFGGRFFKSENIFEILGNLDELNSILGLTYSRGVPHFSDKSIKDIVIKIQRELFNLGALIASSKKKEKIKEIKYYNEKVKELESFIDDFNGKLPELKNFILPSGDVMAIYFHIARAVCRRTERSLVREIKIRKMNELTPVIKYLNRLSDLLFVLARYINKSAKIEETIWMK